MENLIEVDQLRKTYADFALEDISFSVEPGMVVGLIGSNGAGKTTTLKLILGLIDKEGGSASVLGQSVDSAMGASVKENIGVVFDSCSFPNSMRVKDIGSLGAMAYKSWDELYFAELCDRFDLAPKKTVGALSRGMGMKLSLAFALAHHPRLLILDEPTAGLDPIAREDLLEILRDYMDDPNHGVLMSSHITSDLDKIADQVICIDDGKVIFNLAQEDIGDKAGIAHVRSGEVASVLAWLKTQGVSSPYVLKQDYETVVLVPDRFEFARSFPDIAVEGSTIESYMTLVLKGGTQ